MKLYTIKEEIGNSITHGIGALLSIAGLVIMLVFSALYGNAWHIVSVSIYGATLILLYTASTLYHAIQNEKAKKVLRIIDHSSVYLLIAGTYTPYTLILLWQYSISLGWTMFGIIWFLAILGIVFSSLFTGKFKKLSTSLYIAMGWFIIFVMPSLVNAMKIKDSIVGIYLLISGGLFYTIGVIFYILKKKYFHTIWHVFVLIGSILHFFSILLYVI